MTDRHVEMDVMCELASEITAYVIEGFTNAPLDFQDENGDIRYHELAQDVFNNVLDMIDSNLNPESLT